MERRRHQQPNSKKRFWVDYEPIEKFNLLIAVSTTLYLVVTVLIYITAKQQLQISQRAFIYVDDPFLIGDGGMPGVPSGKPAFLVANLHNSGDTPARRVTVDINYCVNDGAVPSNFAFTAFNSASFAPSC